MTIETASKDATHKMEQAVAHLKDDLAGRVREASLEVCEERLAFLTKVVVARRPVS